MHYFPVQVNPIELRCLHSKIQNCAVCLNYWDHAVAPLFLSSFSLLLRTFGVKAAPAERFPAAGLHNNPETSPWRIIRAIITVLER